VKLHSSAMAELYAIFDICPQADKHELARRQYKKIVRYLSSEADRSESVRSLLLAGNLNLALCYLKLDQHQRARDACDAALSLVPDHIKALYRRGLVCLLSALAHQGPNL